MIERARLLQQIEAGLSRAPVATLIGARQVGKTTLARAFAGQWTGPAVHFDLEDPRDEARLAEPMLSLAPLSGLVVIDEVQRAPDIFRVLRVLVDRPDNQARFLVLGSASPTLLRQSSESLAGRNTVVEIGGFKLDELAPDETDRLWLRGGFPRSFLAETDQLSASWRYDFVRAFLERDLPQFGFNVSAGTIRRFWTMLAHWHGQLWNASQFGRSLGVADTTVRRYLDLLADALVVRILPPWHENPNKREVRAPKVFISDSGLAHGLLGIESMNDLTGHPKLGATFEGLAIENIVARLGARPSECFFWRLHSGAELDLLVVRGQRRLGFEIKRTAAPRLSRSSHAARDELKLDELIVVHGGLEIFPLGEKARAIPIGRLWSALPELAA